MNLVCQTDAISEGLEKIRRHSGCIVADVVGLGKSIIGVTIAANLNLVTIIICPPHLKSQWEDFAFDFGLIR
jgi:superfamily II DNA or RNA helicase